MKFVTSAEELGKVVGTVLAVVSSRATIPILSNFLVEAKDGNVIITATDLTVGIRCFLNAKVLEEGATTLPAKKFAQLVREIVAPNVEITTGPNDVSEIVAGSSKFKLHGMSSNEFPSLPDLTGATQFKVSQPTLKELFYRTAFAASRTEGKHTLNGVLAKLGAGKATFTGTDGKRLARAEQTFSFEEGAQGDYIIPIKAVEEIVRCLEGEGEELATVYFMADKVAVQTDATLLISKLLEGEFPDVQRVIPESSNLSMDLHREELMSLLRQVSLFTEDATRSVRFTFAEGELKLSANAMDVGEGRVSMPVNYSGDRLDIAFNPGFFIDILRHCSGETVNLELTDSYNPGKITDPDAESSLFVLMPMRLNEE
jgi:DNA polymerase-3 subunit beta